MFWKSYSSWKDTYGTFWVSIRAISGGFPVCFCCWYIKRSLLDVLFFWVVQNQPKRGWKNWWFHPPVVFVSDVYTGDTSIRNPECLANNVLKHHNRKPSFSVFLEQWIAKKKQLHHYTCSYAKKWVIFQRRSLKRTVECLGEKGQPQPVGWINVDPDENLVIFKNTYPPEV